ncbi:hypothetical protein [Flavisphingomonas formosensis]|nr:hypothetical protein [Sphingomonas formosensis]
MAQVFERKFAAPVDEPGEVPLWLAPSLLLSLIFFFIIGYYAIG